VGDAYPYKRSGGKAFIPWVFYRAVDSGQMWNHKARKGAYTGTLNSARLATYASTAAFDATGSCTIISGMVPIAANTTGEGEHDQIASVTIKPGSILYHRPLEGGQPFVQTIGAAANLESLSNFQHRYSSRIAAKFGISDTDATRKAANPASAAALAISDSSRREFMTQLEPLFRKADLELVSQCAAILNRVMGESLPEDGYRITYHKIPRTPQEEEDQRKRWDWAVQNGQMSEVDVYMEQNPGTTEDQAIAALAAVQARRAALRKAIEAAVPQDEPEDPEDPEPTALPPPAAA
jgi:hypothetical protein